MDPPQSQPGSDEEGWESPSDEDDRQYGPGSGDDYSGSEEEQGSAGRSYEQESGEDEENGEFANTNKTTKRNEQGGDWDTSDGDQDEDDDDDGSDDGSDGMDLEAAGVMFSTPGSVTSDTPEDELLSPLGGGDKNDWSDEGSEEPDEFFRGGQDQNNTGSDKKAGGGWLRNSLFTKKALQDGPGDEKSFGDDCDEVVSTNNQNKKSSPDYKSPQPLPQKKTSKGRKRKEESSSEESDDSVDRKAAARKSQEHAARGTIPDKVETKPNSMNKELNADLTVASIQDKRLITYLSAAVCCLVLVIAVGIVVVVLVVTGKGDEKPAPPSAPPRPNQSPVAAPTTYAPTPEIVEPLQALLSQRSAAFQGGAAIWIEGSPQQKAYLWLLGNANLDTYSEDIKVQRYALATFYYSTGGETSWSTLARQGWVTDTSECDWGSTASNICTGDFYSSLTLDFVGVSGTLPPELALMTTLTRVSVRGNLDGTGLGGSIPDSYGALSNMQTVRLQGNVIGGRLPTSLGAWTEARIVNIQFNQLTGELPIEFGAMFNAVSIDLSGNLLSGTLPDFIGLMQNLGTLSLANNNLVGPMPSDIGKALALSTLDLSGNQLSGALPTEIGQLINMRSKWVMLHHPNHCLPVFSNSVIFCVVVKSYSSSWTAPGKQSIHGQIAYGNRHVVKYA
jgi:hypothetical protein